MRRRALSAAVFVPPLLLVLALGEPWFAALVGVFVVVAAFEAANLLQMAGYRSVPALVAVGALLVALDLAAPPPWPHSSLLLACVFVAGGAFGFREQDTRAGFAIWISTAFASIYVGMLGCLVRLGEAGPDLADSAPISALGATRGWILLLILVVWAYDTGAYVVGIALGKRKFLSHISPSKSYWGVVGGVIASTAVAVAGLWALGQPPAMGVVAGPVLGLVAQGGDLAESMLKRAAGAKDSGTLIPGHGGILDRVDSFLFAAPVAALMVITFVR
jgi:phosphatidate cytidylyltransferase